MKVCRFDRDRIGVVSGDQVHDVTDHVQITSGSGNAQTGDALIQALPALAGTLGLNQNTSKRRSIHDVAWRSPVRAPTKIMAAPNNYHAHLAEMRALDPEGGARFADLREAGLFLKANSSLVGPSEGIAMRFLDRRTDHEIELVAVIGKTGANIPVEQALDHVAGYCLGLDITVRGPEERSLRKSIDTYTVLGPWLVTTDELGAADDVQLTLSVDGAVRQSTSTSDMVYGVADLVEYASRYYTLHPGDLIFTGTPSGVGPIRPGNVLRLEGGVLGRCEVHVHAAEADTLSR
jgi:2,4-diketo-3-deoxy-L-fuconate hydrolase